MPYQRATGSAVLMYDYPYFYKYGSIHVHPFHITSDLVDPETERATAEQILSGGIRHSAAVFREVADRFAIGSSRALSVLMCAEAWAAYQFDLPAAESYDA